MSGHGNHAEEEATLRAAAAMERAGYKILERDNDDSSFTMQMDKDGPIIRVSLEDTTRPDPRAFIEGRTPRVWITADKFTWSGDNGSYAPPKPESDPAPYVDPQMRTRIIESPSWGAGLPEADRKWLAERVADRLRRQSDER